MMHPAKQLLTKRAYRAALMTMLMITSIGLATVLSTGSAQALSGNDFSAGNIMDDSVFYSRNTLSPNDIQNFLNAKVPVCDTNGTKSYNGSQTRAQYGTSRGYPGPYTCLKDYSENVSGVNSNSLCGGSINGGNKRASLIVYEVAQACGINPQVLLVLLQKEQALVTDEWPWSLEYRSATGYGCPDTAPCDAEFYGFFNQVYQAAKAYKRYAATPTNYNYRAGRNNTIGFNPSASCGGSSIYVQNQATASLYIYTPYQPNQAALSNLYGTGDSCSAYGNRNFWRMFNDWFGSTRTTATVYTTQFHNVVDPYGAEAKVGFSLSQRPIYPVTLILSLSNTEVAGFADGNNRVVIQPDNWNNPQSNIVTISGKANGSSKAVDTYVGINQIGSGDTNFGYINPDFIGKPMVTWQPPSATVYRFFSPSASKHTYASRQGDIDALLAAGYQAEGAAFQACNGGETSVIRYRKDTSTLLATQGSPREALLRQQGYYGDGAVFASARLAVTTPVYEITNGAGDGIYTTSRSEADAIIAAHGFTDRGVAFGACSADMIPVFRTYGTRNNAHFYTANWQERNASRNAAFVYEGVGFYTTLAGNPVYRLFSAAKQAHFFTTSNAERSFAQANGYVFEGTAFNIPANPSSPLPAYRLYNGGNGKHFFTVMPAERDLAARSGFVYEGIGFTIQN